ncbi:hypothetical protein G3M81_17890 [Bacillus paralicheniformis]|uniref:hypothetical protein n=1 Tax=Bacillus paralicheniformis TaxID=1648923 RepID=UPI0013EEF135|nr:hypothetical protein [Bacillus paralicheniformis]QII50484.1 hypothetical protein G3M81_17890 [Bacillus paralicheniformis]
MSSAKVVRFPDGMKGKDRIPGIRLFRNNNEFSRGSDDENTKTKIEIQRLKRDIKQIKETIEAYSQLASSKNGGEEMMERIQEKLSEIDKKVAVIEERTKKIDNLPTKEEMRILITETISNLEIATKEHVELKVVSSRNTIILWTIGTFIALVSITATIIKLL